MQKYSHLPQLEVGILFSPEICFLAERNFHLPDYRKKYTGAYNIRQTEDGYLLSPGRSSGTGFFTSDVRTGR